MLLVAAMLFTMTGVSAFAEGEDSEEKEAKTVLVFGASTSSGYGLANFVNENRGFAVENNDLNEWTIEKARNAGKGKISEDSYPWKLKKYIAETEFDNDLNKVTLVPMTFNGMRTNELHGLLLHRFYAFFRGKHYLQRLDQCPSVMMLHPGREL